MKQTKSAAQSALLVVMLCYGKRVKGHPKVLCKVTKFSSALQAERSAVFLSCHPECLSRGRGARGFTARVPRRKGRKKQGFGVFAARVTSSASPWE